MSALNPLPGLVLIGERLNTHRPDIARIIQERDEKALLKEVKRQQRCGATHLDYNASGSVTPDNPNAERDALLWMLDTALPVMRAEIGVSLDSLSPDVIAAGLERLGPRPGTIINGMTADFEHIQKLLPLVAKSSVGLVVIAGSRSQSPRSSEERLNLATQVMDVLGKARILEERIYIDPQVLPLAADPEQPKAVLHACAELKKRFPTAHLLAGLSNVSFNLPQRRLLNRTFAAMLIAAGVDALICDPCDRSLRQTILAAQTLMGKDDFFATYLSEIEQYKG